MKEVRTAADAAAVVVVAVAAGSRKMRRVDVIVCCGVCQLHRWTADD